MKKGIREKSADTVVLENLLRCSQIGCVISYDAMSTALGRDVRRFCVGNLVTARNNLRGEKIHFDVIRGQGLKRLNGVEAVGTSRSYVRRAKNAASKGMKVLANIEFEQLPDDAKNSRNFLP